MSGNLSASWGSPEGKRPRAVSVRCPDCGWRTARAKRSDGYLYGICIRCFRSSSRLVLLEPTPTLAEKRHAKAKQELKVR